jgi:hypothetical protein
LYLSNMFCMTGGLPFFGHVHPSLTIPQHTPRQSHTTPCDDQQATKLQQQYNNNNNMTLLVLLILTLLLACHAVELGEKWLLQQPAEEEDSVFWGRTILLGGEFASMSIAVPRTTDTPSTGSPPMDAPPPTRGKAAIPIDPPLTPAKEVTPPPPSSPVADPAPPVADPTTSATLTPSPAPVGGEAQSPTVMMTPVNPTPRLRGRRHLRFKVEPYRIVL